MRSLDHLTVVKPGRRDAIITLAYAVLAAAWIYSSDSLLRLVISDRDMFAAISTYKGWVFVAVTSALLYSLLSNIRRDRAANPSEDVAPDDTAPFSVWPPLAIFVLFVAVLGTTLYLIYSRLAHVTRMHSVGTNGNPDLTEIAHLVSIFGLVLVVSTALSAALWLRQQRTNALLRDLRSERQRSALAKHLDYLTRYANDVILLLDENGRILDANERAFSTYGYPREELLSMPVRDLRSPLALDSYDADWQRAHSEDGVIFETIHQRRDGTTFPVEVSSRAIASKGLYLRQSIIRDISDRRRAEESALLWGKVLENSAEGMVITDPYGVILTVNKAFTGVTGYTADEVIGKNPRVLASGRHDAGFYHVMWRTIRESGRWQGEIWNRRKNGEVYLEWLSVTAVRNANGELTHYVGTFTDITERKQSAERIQFLSNHDFLTGLPNWSLMNDLVQQALATARRKESHLALLFLDVDRFKTINDSLGYAAGDALLQRITAKLTECVRGGDTLARLGGDEFLVMLPELARSQDAAVVAEKIRAAMKKHVFIQGHEIGVTLSIGISIFPNDGQDVDSLTRGAEAAMYHAKERGRNNYQYFTPDMNARAFESLAMEMSLRAAIDRNEFTLHYQPQVQTGTGQIVGVEALIRWHHQDLGLVPPGRFIPIAEEHGLIVQIGEWVLRTACRQIRMWLDEGLPAVPVAVNMSAVQFRQAGLAKRVGEILLEEGVEPRYVELELTESIIMRDAEQTIAVLAELHDMGVSLAIDDFGTGYSSLSYLRRFPIHKLKIDQSFVRDITTNPDAAAIAAAIISMGKSMKLRVIAEGVETAEQLAFLSSKQCDELQGFHIGRPMEADRFSTLLREGKPVGVAVASA